MAFGAEQDARAGVIFLRDFVGVKEVGGGENPGARGDGAEGVGNEAQRARGGLLRRCVGSGDEDSFAGKGEGKIAERDIECVLRQRDEADKETTGGGGFCSGR